MARHGRRRVLANLGIGLLAGVAGCSEIPVVGDRVGPTEFPEDPPQGAIETAKAHVRALGRGDYEGACRDRCRLAVEDGRRQLEAQPMSESDLRQWAREAEEWYGAAGFSVESVEVTDSEKMDPKAVGAQGYDAGYWLTMRYEGSGNIANPFRKGVIQDDGQWWVLVATF